MNIPGIKVHGVESFVRYQPWECLSLRATHTYQHTNNMDSDTAPIAYGPRTWPLSGQPTPAAATG